MQPTADFHHHVTKPRLAQADGLLEQAAALDAAVDRLDTHAPPRERPIPRVLRPRQLVPPRFFRRLEHGHALQCERLNAHVLPQLTPDRQRRRRGISDALVMDTTRRRVPQA